MTQNPQTVSQALQIAVDHQQHGRLSEAAQIYRAILAQHPNQSDALHLLGVVAVMSGQAEKAIDLIGRAITVNPSAAGYHDSLGIALATLGRENEAVASHRKAIELDPQLFNAHYNLGSVLASSGRSDEAISSFEIAVKLKPNDLNARNGLGIALLLSKRVDEAISQFEEAKRLSPNSAQVYMHLGTAYLECAAIDESLACFDRALALEPPTAKRLDTKIFAMHYHPRYDSPAILKTAKEWDKLVTASLPQPLAPHSNDRTPDRKLRIGYVSPDFRDHPVGRSILPLLSHHDRGQFEIYCYWSAWREDSITEKLRESAGTWRDIGRLRDERADEMIRSDRIDILVDLALHTVGNRLSLFARKPAPVQMSYLGYCSTTGLSAMDYRISDPYVDPPEVDLAAYSEQTLRLLRNYLCYAPTGDAPDISPPPYVTNGIVTFGCLNKFAKCSPASLDLWARILNSIPDSRLILHAGPGKHLDRVRQQFQRGGVSPSRLEFIGKQDWLQYMQTYARIDIALDPFPYNGGITTCEALSMGVPAITLSGKTGVGRVGRSILSNVGLPELIAQTPNEYVQLAINFAKDINRLKQLRTELRPRLQASPMMDGKQLTRDIESIYRTAWRTFCTDWHMRILGIDPGLKITGYGVVDFGMREPKLIDGGVFRFSAKASLAHRLVELEKELNDLFDEYKPDICAVEQLYAHYKHPRTAILMGHARGVILLAAQRRNIRIEQYSANRIKKSVVSHGHAGKLQVQRTIQQIFRLKTLPDPPDVADALAVALCCGRFIVDR